MQEHDHIQSTIMDNEGNSGGCNPGGPLLQYYFIQTKVVENITVPSRQNVNNLKQHCFPANSSVFA